MAQYIFLLADYDIELKHLPGIKNRADPLSRRPDHDDRSTNNEQVIVLPDKLFIRMIKTIALDQQLIQNQRKYEQTISDWKRLGIEW